MTGRYIVEATDGDVRYEIELSRKFLEIIGDSGSGKSYFAEIVNSYLLRRDLYNVRIIGDASIEVFTISTLSHILSENTIYVMDEDVSYAIFSESRDRESEMRRRKLESRFVELIRNCDCYFIIIYRSEPKCIPCALSCVVELYDCTDGVIRQRPIFRDKIYNPVCSENIIAEDSKLGYKFYDETLVDSKVVSSGGNLGLTRCLTDIVVSYGIYDILIIADNSNFAYGYSLVKDALKSLETKGYRVNLRWFLPESFEYLLLASGVIPCEKYYIENTEDYADTIEHKSWESFYTSKAKENIRLVFRGMKYDKGDKDFENYLLRAGNVIRMYNFIEELVK